MLQNSLLSSKPSFYSERFGESMIDLANHNFRLPVIQRYRKVKVSKSHIARPDIIAKYLWNGSEYGDLICKINGISNPFELNEGDILIIPLVNQLDEFFRTDSFDNTIYEDNETSDYVPAPKQKNQKRTPSDAVVGDNRFKVDAANRLIIY